MKRFTPQFKKGFTLLELMFVMMFIVLFARLTVPKVNALLRGNLRGGATKLSGFFKSAYERSVMRGEHIRIYFDLDKNTYWASIYTEEPMIPLLTADTKLDEAILEFEKLAEGEIGDDDAVENKTSFEKIDAGSLKKAKLPNGVRVKRVYKANVGKQDDANKQEDENNMIVHLDFFPNGFSTQSIVYIENDFENVYSIIIPPIGGQSKIEKGEIDVL